MKIQVLGKHISTMFNTFSSNKKSLFNFRTNGRILDIQYIGEYTVDRSINCFSMDNDFNEVEITVRLNSSISMLEDDEMVSISFAENALYLEQDDYYIICVVEYEGRRTFFNTDDLSMVQLDVNSMHKLLSDTSICTALAKELSIPNPDPMFSCSRYYLDFKQTCYISVYKFIECSIPVTILKEIISKLDKTAKYFYSPENAILLIKCNDYTFWVPSMIYNIDSFIISVFNKIMETSTLVCKTSLKDISNKMVKLSMAHPKTKMTLQADDKGISITHSDSMMRIKIGSVTSPICTMDVTSAQINVMARLFKDEEIQVRKGDNVLCLTNGKMAILISGLIY